jgi:hypothetical protein
MNNVEILFQDKGIRRAGTYVFPKQVAIDFINECKKSDINILGIDALLIGDATQPSMENSIDFTANPYLGNVNDVWATAKTFLNERSDKYHFEIVCGD